MAIIKTRTLRYIYDKSIGVICVKIELMFQVKRFGSPRVQSRKFRFCLTQIVGIHSLFRNGTDYFLSPDERQLHVHLISRDILPSKIYFKHNGMSIVQKQLHDIVLLNRYQTIRTDISLSVTKEKWKFIYLFNFPGYIMSFYVYLFLSVFLLKLS